MRIVIDMQGAQSASRFRGIGRYTMAFAQAVARNRGEHEIILALSGLFPDTIESIRAGFDGLLPQANIRVWYAQGPVCDEDPSNSNRRKVAELLREAFLAGLCPDVIHVCSLFEGYVDDAVTSIGHFDHRVPTSVTLYDLIPLLNPDQYLAPNPRYAAYYQRKLESLKNANIKLAISEYARDEGVHCLSLDPDLVINVSTAIGPEFHQIQVEENIADALRHRFGISRPFILYAGATDDRKNLPRLIEAYAALTASIRKSHQMVFAGGMPIEHRSKFIEHAKLCGLKQDELIFTDYVRDSDLFKLYNICKLFVFPSWHEGFGLPALEAMACGAAVIGANTTSLPEVIGLQEALFDPFDVNAIRDKIYVALTDETFLTKLREHGLAQANRFSWDNTAQSAIRVWERAAESQTAFVDETVALNHSRHALVGAIAPHLGAVDEGALLHLAAQIALNEGSIMARQLLVDISELVKCDARTGIQRVVRSILKEWLENPPAGYRVEPVYATGSGPYRYARQFSSKFMCMALDGLVDEPIDYAPGDCFFALDLEPRLQVTHRSFYQHLRQYGVSVQFLVHDLLCVRMPQFFLPNSANDFEQWLTVVAESDGAVCVSEVTARDLEKWCAVNVARHRRPLKIAWSHNGADIDNSEPTTGLPESTETVLNQLRSYPSFLMVGTIEPRKGHSQVLEAFEHLWHTGIIANLAIVGKQGWMVEQLIDRLRKHPELGKRLFWLEGVSDEYLEKVYAASTCLIAASYGEGFGLPLIEAAQHKLPIICRDIPVFREVAGEHAFYFSSNDPNELANSIQEWLKIYANGQYPKSTEMPWLTWKQSSEQLLAALGIQSTSTYKS